MAAEDIPICGKCGQAHVTRHGLPSCPAHITSGDRKGEPCRNEAGKSTDHPGIGQCRKHGGVTPNAKSHAREIMIEAELGRQLGLDQWEPVTDPYSALASIAGKTVKLQEILQAKVEELASLRQYGGEMGERIDIIYEAFERALDRSTKVLNGMARLDLDARIAKLQAAIDDETSKLISGALEAALSSVALEPEQRSTILSAFGARLRGEDQPALPASK